MTNSRVSISSSPPEEKGLLSGQYWGELRIFAEVARAKSFNRAAERLGLSQPTIGRKVRRLQDLLGTQLFVSTKQGVRLTSPGEELASALLDLDQSLFSIATDLKARADDAEGIVSVAITDGMAAFFAAPAVRGFSARYPKVRLHFKTMGDMGDLRANQADMMVTFFPSERRDIRCEQVGTLHFIPLASADYVARHGMPTRDNVEQHLFLQSHFYEAALPAWRGWQALCARGRIAHYCDNTFAYGMLAKQGLGIALLGTYLINGRSAVPLDLGAQASLPMYVHVLAGRLEARPVRIAFDWLRETFHESNPWFGRDLNLTGLPDAFAALDVMMDHS